MKRCLLSILLLILHFIPFCQLITTLGSNPVTGGNGFLCGGGFINPAGISIGGKSDYALFTNVVSIGCSYYLHANLNSKAQASTYAGFHIAGVNVLNIINMMTVETYDEDGMVERSTASSLLQLITAGEGDIFFKTTQPYTAVRLVFKPTISLLQGIKIYFGYASNYNPLFPLPISISAESVTEFEDYHTLTWEAGLQEIGTVMEVERSIAGSAFRSVGVIKEAGPLFKFKIDAKEYSTYRIKITNQSGQAVFSKIFYVKNKKELWQLIVPTPFKVNNYISVNVKNTGSYNLIVTNGNGQKVLQQSIKQSTQVKFSGINQFSKGIYFVSLLSGEGQLLKTTRLLLE